MKSITIIFIFVSLTFSHSSTVSDINLSSLVTLFLPDINNALKPISASKSAGPLSASVNVHFSKIERRNVYIAVESNEIHLKVSNFVAQSSAELQTFRWTDILIPIPIPFIRKFIKKHIRKVTSVTAKGTVKTTIDLKFKLVTKNTGMPGIEITQFRTNTDLSFIFGPTKVSAFAGILSPIKREIERRILDKIGRRELQKIVDKNVQKLLGKIFK